MNRCSARCRARGLCISAGIVLIVMTASCAGVGSVDVLPEQALLPQQAEAVPPAAPAAAPMRQTGVASWYGKDEPRRRTAGGELFTMRGLSAAHRTLPIGSMVRVTNLENSRQVVVRVTDRGPFIKNRIIDLSYDAARELGFLAKGVTQVAIERLDELSGPPSFTVHAAQYVEEENARLLKERLSAKFETIAIIPGATNLGRLYQVEVGVYPTEEKAELVAGRVMQEGLEPVVIRKDP